MRTLALTLVLMLGMAAACARSRQGSQAPAPDDLLAVGTPAPDFEATAHDGSRVHLAELRGRDVVLYFYPKDDTPGCTKEACSFRDAWAPLQAAGVVVLGVSTQDAGSHGAFAQKYHLPFPLIPDERGELAARYRVPVTLGLARRITYLIGKDGRVACVWSRVDVGRHAQDILDAVAAEKGK
jgi:peroxiredoxin Q/BCP